MKIGIFGLPLAGKKTIFKILTGNDPGEAPHKQKAVEGFAEINDPRLFVLQQIYMPRRTVKARIYLELLPDLDAESIASGAIFPMLSACDAICLVTRSFSDDTVYHPAGSVDPERDLRQVNSEMILHDLAFVEKRIEKIEKERKPKSRDTGKELALMLKMKSLLEEESPLRTLELESPDRTIISGYPFITAKPLITVLNSDEESPRKPDDSIDKLLSCQKTLKVELSAKIESEINEIPPGEERREMLAAMGISVPASETLKRAFLDSLDLITFFTASSEEIRQWLTASDSTADKAAGGIHTDMERGFIRAEVIKYEDLKEAGSEDKAAGLGKKMLKGRDYPVADGDILSIRFNV